MLTFWINIWFDGEYDNVWLCYSLFQFGWKNLEYLIQFSNKNYANRKLASKKQNLECKCVLQESCKTVRRWQEIYSTCQGRSLRWRLTAIVSPHLIPFWLNLALWVFIDCWFGQVRTLPYHCKLLQNLHADFVQTQLISKQQLHSLTAIKAWRHCQPKTYVTDILVTRRNLHRNRLHGEDYSHLGKASLHLVSSCR